MSSIVVIGGCIMDLMSYVSRFPRPGETIAGLDFRKGFGGKGANQCVMAKNLGASTAMIAKVGDDTFGREYLEYLKEKEINSEFVTITKTGLTSTAAIAVSNDGQNNIIYVPGAIMELTSNDILAAEDLIKGSKTLLCTYECPFDTLLTALTLAKKHNVTTVLNAAPATDKAYEQLYPLVDFICLNEVEAEDATGLPLKALDETGPIIRKLHEKGCSTVILTLGSKGAVFQGKHEEKSNFVSARKVKAVDCTGAGDAFVGSLVYFLSEYPTMSFEDIMERACEIATLTVMKNGTQSSFPNREDLPAVFFK